MIGAVKRQYGTLMMATSMGTKEELARVVDIIVREGEHRGLTLSRTATLQAPSVP